MNLSAFLSNNFLLLILINNFLLSLPISAHEFLQRNFFKIVVGCSITVIIINFHSFKCSFLKY